MNEINFTKNSNGIPVKMCCASCKYKQFDKGDKRVCTNGEGAVRPDSYCGDWEMREGLDKAGMGGGMIKKKSYLMYVLNYPQPEIPFYHVPLQQIREEYEKKLGTIYQNF